MAWRRAVAVMLALSVLVGTTGCGLEDKFKDPVVREVELDLG